MIKEKDLVTVTLDVGTYAANTFEVARKLDGESLLNHPLMPEVYILKKDSELNQATPQMRTSLEYQLKFCQRHSQGLSFDLKSELDALVLFYVIRRKFSRKQKQALATIGGVISAIYFDSDLSKAIASINQNVPLLDEFNQLWYANLTSIFSGSKKNVTPAQRISIFNMAGFVLAQLEA